MTSENDTLNRMKEILGPDSKIDATSLKKVIDSFYDLPAQVRRTYANENFINDVLKGMEQSADLAPEEDRPGMRRQIIQFREEINGLRDIHEEKMTFDDLDEVVAEFEDAATSLFGETIGLVISGGCGFLNLDIKELLWESEDGWYLGQDLGDFIPSHDFSEALCQALNSFANKLLKVVDEVRQQAYKEKMLKEEVEQSEKKCASPHPKKLPTGGSF